MTISREPVIITGAITAVLMLGISFGLHVTPAQVGLICAAVVAVMAVFLRKQVVPNATLDTALKLPENSTKKDLAVAIKKEDSGVPTIT